MIKLKQSPSPLVLTIIYDSLESMQFGFYLTASGFQLQNFL